MIPTLQALPKVELHLHLETSLRLRRLAERLHPDRSPFTEPHLVADPGAFKGYDRLRRMRYGGRAGRIPDELYTADNIRLITLELLEEAAAQNIRYVEVRVGGRRAFALVGVRPMFEVLEEASLEAERVHGIRSGFIVTLVRERGPEEAEHLVKEAALYVRDRDGVVGVDLAGDEENFPPAMFMDAMAKAREARLGITVHAGEFSGPSSIWTAIYQLGAKRIGHALRAVEDPDLLAYMRDHQITVEICPTSNLRLGLISSLAEHPMRALIEAGVPVTVNSDDPLLLGTDLTRELHLVQQALALPFDQVVALMVNAAQAAFLAPGDRQALEREVAHQAPAAS